MPNTVKRLAEFPPFTLNASEHILKRGSYVIDLPQRTIAILGYLIENRDRWISKNELLTNFWPDVTVTDDSVHRQIFAIRGALHDSAENPQFVQTKYRQGWRFIADVTETIEARTDPETVGVPPPEVSSPMPPTETTLNPSTQLLAPRGRPKLAKSRFVGMIAVALLIATGAELAVSHKPARHARVLDSTQLTSDGGPKTGPLLTDGRRIFFFSQTGVMGRIMAIPVSGGEALPLNASLPNVRLRSISADGSSMLLMGVGDDAGKVWIYGLNSRKLRLVKSKVHEAALSPDGQRLAASVDDELSICNLAGANCSKVRLRGRAESLQWSPDSGRIRFALTDFPGALPSSIWEYSPENGTTRRRFENAKGQDYFGAGIWSQNGKYYFYEVGRPITALWVNRETFHVPVLDEPRTQRLTTGPPGSWDSPLVSTADNETIFTINHFTRTELVRLNTSSGVWEPTWNRASILELSYSKDFQWVSYTDLHDYSIWKARPDGRERLRLTAGGIESHQSHWSPDNKWIAYMGQNTKGEWAVFRVPSVGGPTEQITAGANVGVPTWSPDGRSIIFGERLTKKPRSEMEIQVVDIRSRAVSQMPGTRGLWSPRWSPNGKFILALSSDSRALCLRATSRTEWKEVARLKWLDNATWSVDSSQIYFNGEDETSHRRMYRLNIATGRLEHLVDLDGFQSPTETWFGVDAAGLPLALHAAQVDDIYRLKCELP